jgi:ankyrin repeat protein
VEIHIMTVSSSDRPNVDHAQNQARLLQKAVASADLKAIARVRAHITQRPNTADEDIATRELTDWDARRVIARERGFAEWFALARHVGEGRELPPEGTLASLVEAVEEPDPSTVQAVLAEYPHLVHARLYSEHDTGDTLLHRTDPGFRLPKNDQGWSLDDGTTDAHLEVAGILIDCGADVNATGGSGNTAGETPVGAAGWAGNLRMCELLLDRGADPNHVSDWGFDALGTIADHKKADIFKAMVAAGARYEPRHLLQCGMKDQLVEVLDREPHRLEELIDLGHFDGENGTLIHVAVEEGLEEMVSLLLDRGADVQALDNRGRTPLHRALNPGHAKRSETVISMLISYGAQTDIRAAIGLGDAAQVTQLLDEDPSIITTRGTGGMTLLHFAAEYNQPELASMLLERGAAPDIVSDAGDTAFDLASSRGHHAVADILRAGSG